MKEKLRLSKQTLQPIPIFVGNLTCIEAAYVAVNNVLYKVNSSLEALDLCFKLFDALDCAYPEKAKVYWLFIQKCFYLINFPTDKCSRSASTLIGEDHAISVKEAQMQASLQEAQMRSNQ